MRLDPLGAGMTAICLLACGAALADNSPIGIWRTYDDDGGQATSLVRIEEKNGVLEGRVTRVFSRKGHEDTAPICAKCDGEYKNQPIVGMKILSNMRRDGDEFNGGQILDPDSGNSYRCTMRVVDGKLVVRGFLGLALFGRTQTWMKEP